MFIRLCFADTLDKTPPEVASILTGATAPGKNGYRHSMVGENTPQTANGYSVILYVYP